jgi:acetylornithine deacetylase/succinyl-diaminopimelate desuccinylase-like protein
VSDTDALTNDTVALLQQLIRNRCVNDGSVESGEERRSVDLLAGYLEGGGLDLERYEPAPGRASLVTRIEGSDPSAPTLLLMGHTDVVPVNEAGWRNDPFGGEIIDGEIWGRGAIDMLNLTASMAVAMRHLADTGFRPRGTLVYLAVADEEASGTYGAHHLVANERDAVRADYVITESGGIPMPAASGTKLPVLASEKGLHWSRLRVKGTPGHGSMPYGTDNALVKASEVVRRIADHQPAARITDGWRSFVEALDLPEDFARALTEPEGFDAAMALFPPGMQKLAHACTHTTMAPTMMQAGSKLNIIPDTVELQLDIRTLPGDGDAEVRAMLDEALGDLAGAVEVVPVSTSPATESPVDTPLWDSMQRVVRGFYPDGRLIPMLMTGATDARFFRGAGSVAYGFGLFSRAISLEELATMGHGDNERVDVESLRMVTDLWPALARDFLG